MQWGLQRAPPMGGSQRGGFNDNGFQSDEEGDEGGAPWYEAEIEMLKANLKALNTQMFQERKSWLAEKTALESAVVAAGSGAPSPAHSFNSAAGRKGGLERSPQLDRGGGEELAGLRAQLAAVTAERDAARQEAATLKSDAQKWSAECTNLQREVNMLRMAGGDGGESDERIAELEEERASLASELNVLKESLKTNVLVPKSHMANLQQYAAQQAGRQSSSGAAGSPPGGARPTLASMGSAARLNSISGSAPPDLASAQATISRLNAEITRLQADMYILKDECVPVPKAEFASLKGVHTEKAGLEQEVRSLKQELADVTRLNKMLREEMELIKEDHMAITMQEYDELRRAQAEKSALELKIEAQAKYYAQVPREELAELQSCRGRVVSLEAKLAALQATASVGADEKARALQGAMDEAAELRVKVMDLEATVADLRREVKAGEGRQQVLTDLQDKLRVLDLQLQAAQQEKARIAIRVRSLEEELESSKTLAREAQAESARLAVDFASARDSNSSLAQEVSQLARERGELDARLQEHRTERENLTNELVDAKLELARLREMEVLYKKSLMAAKKQLYGTPSEAAQ